MSLYLLFLIVIIIAGSLIWRLYSTRHSLPCPSWLSWMVELDNPFAKAHKANEIIGAIPIQNGIKILDIGCGPGRVSLPLAQKISDVGGHVTGLDIQTEMINKTSAKASTLNINNIDFINGDIDLVPITQQYDVILMICVLGEIPKVAQERVMKKVVSHLEPKGILSITETVFDPHYQNRQKIEELMKSIGYIQTKFVGNRLAFTIHFMQDQ